MLVQRCVSVGLLRYFSIYIKLKTHALAVFTYFNLNLNQISLDIIVCKLESRDENQVKSDYAVSNGPTYDFIQHPGREFPFRYSSEKLLKQEK